MEASAKNRGAAGIDGQTIDSIIEIGSRSSFSNGIQDALQTGEYRPTPVRRRYIPKS